MVGDVPFVSSVVVCPHYQTKIVWCIWAFQSSVGDEALTQLPERCHRLQCTCGSCTTLESESSTLKPPKTTKQKGKSSKSSANQTFRVFEKKRKKVFPPSHCKVCGKAAIVFLDFSKDIERSRRRWPRKCLLGHVWPGSSTNLGIGLPKWIANLFQNVRPTLSLRPIPIWSEVTCQFSQSRQVQAQVRKFLLPGCKPTSARTRTASTCMYWTAVNSAGFANWGGQTLLMGHQLTLPPNRFFNITTKHVCKAFLQEYRIRDIRFRVLWSKQDPNAKGEDEHERNRKKTGPQRRREKRPRKKYEKITRKKWEKNWTSSSQP